MKPELVLIGAGGHARAVTDVIELEDRFRILGFLDTKLPPDTLVLGYPVLGGDDLIAEYAKKGIAMLITIGQIKSPAPRIGAFEQIVEAGGELPRIISPRAHVSAHATIGAGTVVMHNVVLGPSASVARNCILNTGAIVEHDVKIGNHCHISTGAIVNGGAIIGDEVFVGSGSVVREYVSVARGTVVPAGQRVMHSEG